MESHTEEVHGVMNCCQGNATQDKKQNLATNTHSPLHVPHPITDPPFCPQAPAPQDFCGEQFLLLNFS